MNRFKCSFLIIISIFFICLCTTRHAFATEPAPSSEPTVKLISAYNQYDNQEYIWLGLEFSMPEGWKTYWKYNSDLGKPLTISWWSGSENVKEIEIYWSEPKRMDLLGFNLVGYQGDMVFPLKVFVKDPSKQIKLRLQTNFLLCKEDICLGKSPAFEITIPSGKNVINLEGKEKIDRYIRLSPIYNDLATLKNIYTYTNYEKSKLYYHVVFSKPWEGIEDLFIASTEIVILGAPEKISDDPNLIHFRIPILHLKNNYLHLGVSFKTDSEYLEFQDYKSSLTENLDIKRLLLIFLISLAGGFILNFMPCVLPVLTIKAFGAISSQSISSTKERLNHLASAAGIIFTFLLFALIAILLAKFGYLVGWGMHFRQPLFILVIAFILVVFACNLFGFFEIRMPSINLKSSQKKEEGLLGHFSTGILATLLATPCTAPFIGTAISFALSQTALFTASIFLFIGLGFAFPYFYLAISPKTLRRILPKPGNWMIKVKIVVGFILLITTAWLFWIMMFMIPMNVNYLIWGSSAFIIAALFITQRKFSWLRNVAWLFILLIFTANVYWVKTAPTSEELISKSAYEVGIPFDPNKIQPALAEGKTVFLIFTAQWCVTCKYNENFILNSKPVHDALSQKNVLVMVADWTNPNDTIAKFLQRYEQYAIPTYIVFSKEYPQGKVLNSLLTQDEVLKYLKPKN